MDGGRRWWLVELADEASLRAATPDWNAISQLAHDTESMGVCVFARSDDPVYYLAVRAWVGAPAHFEDAASGAANATLAAWLASRDALPGDTGFYRVSQGREVGHDAIIELLVDDDGEVWSGGARLHGRARRDRLALPIPARCVARPAQTASPPA